MVCQGPLVYIGKSDLTMGGLSYGSEPIKKARPPLAAPSPQRQNKGAPTPSRTLAALRAQPHSHTCDLTDQAWKVRTAADGAAVLGAAGGKSPSAEKLKAYESLLESYSTSWRLCA